MNENLTHLLTEVNSLLAEQRVLAPISVEIEENVPETVRRLRIARARRRLNAIEAAKSRSGDNHYARKRLKRRIEYHKYDRVHRKNVYRREFKNHENRYKRQQRLWLRRISKERLERCMSVEDYSALLSYVPPKIREMYPHVRAGGRNHNLDRVPAELRYANQYPNEEWKCVEDYIHSIVRVNGEREYTLDNVIVVDELTRRVLFDCTLDRL